MASTKAKTTKTTKSIEKKQTARKVSPSKKEENKKHIFAGFLLGLTTGALLFCVYLLIYVS